MIIEINGFKYELVVEDKYIQDDVEVLCELTLEEYCKLSEKKINGLMYDLEDILSDMFGKKVNLKKDFGVLRSKILDGSGLINRLPEGLSLRPID